MKCPNCGAENRATARFCISCGNRLVEPPADAIPAPPVVETAGPEPGDSPRVPTPSSDLSPDEALVEPNVEPEASGAPVQEPPPAVEPNAVESPAETSVEQSAPETSPTASEPEPADAAPNPHSTPEALAPLVAGDKIQDRYEILEVVRVENGSNLYRARDALRCPDCGTDNAADEQFCQNCGRELTERGTVLLEERRIPEDDTAVLPPAFAAGDRVYRVQPDVAPTPTVVPFPSGVSLSFGAKSDVGITRQGDPDEDSIFALASSVICKSIAQPTVGLFIVADGVGGSEAGEVASKKAVQVVSADLLQELLLPALAGATLDDETVRTQIQQAVLDANTQVLQLAQEKNNDMGTTITLALVIDDRAYVANAGDSRTYLFADGKLQQVTQDHSLVASLIASGMAQPEDIYTHPQRNVIFRSLGAKSDIEVNIFPAEGGALKLQAGVRLVLCCDGLWEMARDEGIEEILLLESDPSRACARLVARANDAGGEDNISVIVVNVSA